MLSSQNALLLQRYVRSCSITSCKICWLPSELESVPVETESSAVELSWTAALPEPSSLRWDFRNRKRPGMVHRKDALALRWRHNGCDGVSNHQPHDCLLNRLFGWRSKKTSKLRVTGLCAGNSPGTGEFPAQMASNAENVSIWWRHHGKTWRYQMEKNPCYWTFVREIHQSPVDFPHKGQWHGALFSLICAWIHRWANNRDAGDLRRHCAHYDILMNAFWAT